MTVLPKVDAYRRFGSLPLANPEGVKGLAPDHPAMREKRPLFTHRMVTATESPRLLVDGVNNRKIGGLVDKGPWAGKPIFTLTLAERVTCPESCANWSTCYGNAMQWARRHLPGDDLEVKLEAEVRQKALEHPQGFVVRLHVLGDFYSRVYMALWTRLMAEVPQLHVFGYTARLPESGETLDADIGRMIGSLNKLMPERWAVRFSRPSPAPMGATVIDQAPELAAPSGGTPVVVCPAETEKTACCSTCGLCWSPGMRDKAIAFIRHGKGSNTRDAIIKMAGGVGSDRHRPILAVALGDMPKAETVGTVPQMLMVDPHDLWVDETYQRSLSRRSLSLIKRIVAGWNWNKFKPPSVARDEQGRLCVIDGQHTAIAAVTRGEGSIPVMLHEMGDVAIRADAFIGMNRDRLATTATQIHHSSVIAGDKRAVEVEAVCKAAGVSILKTQPPSGAYLIGETMAVKTIRRMIDMYGAQEVENVLKLLVEAKCAPLQATFVQAVCFIANSEQYAYDVRRADLIEVIRGQEEVLLEGGKERAQKMNAQVWRGLVADLYHETSARRAEIKRLNPPKTLALPAR